MMWMKGHQYSNLSKTTLKKEFRISGTIGPTNTKGEKSYLSYISLIHQLESGQRLKYNDEEIIAGVIRAMAPGLRIRTVIETLANLKLPRLRLVLRSHFNEKAASELFHELSNCVQHDTEEADEILMRAYELRQKLLFAAQEIGSTVRYEVALIQSVFINTIETGIIAEGIRSRIRPYLTPPTAGQTPEHFEVQNDQLIHHTNLAKFAENERRNKIRATRNVGKKYVHMDYEEDDANHKTEKRNEDTENVVLAAIQTLRGEISVIKTDVNQLRENRSPSQLDNRRRPQYKK